MFSDTQPQNQDEQIRQLQDQIVKLATRNLELTNGIEKIKSTWFSPSGIGAAVYANEIREICKKLLDNEHP